MLEIANLRYAYSGKTALDIPDFRLDKGRHALLLGASGSGKSTLLNLVAGLLRPQTGSLLVQGADLSKMSVRESDTWRGRTIGLLPQQLALIPSLTVRENILLPAYAAGKKPDYERANELLITLGLAEKTNQKPKSLSQGQRQRVALARAVYSKPALLLADEPTANLDDQACTRALALLKAVAKSVNASLIVATHDNRVIDMLSDANVLKLSAEKELA